MFKKITFSGVPGGVGGAGARPHGLPRAQGEARARLRHEEEAGTVSIRYGGYGSVSYGKL